MRARDRILWLLEVCWKWTGEYIPIQYFLRQLQACSYPSIQQPLGFEHLCQMM